MKINFALRHKVSWPVFINIVIDFNYPQMHLRDFKRSKRIVQPIYWMPNGNVNSEAVS